MQHAGNPFEDCRTEKTARYEIFPAPAMIENLSELICRQPTLLQLVICKTLGRYTG